MKKQTSETASVRQDDILALVEDGPKESGKLAEWLGHPQARVIAACTEMVKAGRLQRLPHPDRRWAMPGYVLPTAERERIASVHKGPLRQPHERPETIQLLPDREPSWWVGKSREDFNAAAREQFEKMRLLKKNLVQSQVND